MHKPQLIPIAILVTLLFLAPLANADYSTSFPYTKFTSTAYHEATDKTYTEFQATILDKLTYNTTTLSPSAEISFKNSTDASAFRALALKFVSGGAVTIWDNVGGSAVQIGSATWASDEPTV